MTKSAPEWFSYKVDQGLKEYDERAILVTATDMGGVILGSNNDFVEVSGFEPDKLLSAPHQIVRHPSMPRGIFHILWQRLNEGKAVGFFIQNMAADGRHYWTFATITPFSKGFLSLQIKPQSKIFDQTRAIYEKLLEEESAGLNANASGQRFKELLVAAGYDSLGDYTRKTLACELSTRSDFAEVGGERLKKFEELNNLVDKARQLTDQIVGVFRQVRGEPVNLRILATRMENAGAAISTISKNYEAMAGEMQHTIQRLNGTEMGILMEMQMSVSRGQYAGHIAVLMQAALQRSSPIRADSSSSFYINECIKQQAQAMDLKYHEAMLTVANCGRTIPDICRHLRRRVKGLDLVKLLCKVESGRNSDQDSGLNGIIDRLEFAHDNNDRFLSELSKVASKIQNSSNAR